MDVNQGTEKLGELAEYGQQMGESAKQRLSEVSNRMMERSRMAATSTDHYVHEYAWSSVALAALLGVAIGLMIRR